MSPEEALKGRSEAITIDKPHYMLKTQMMPPFPEEMERVIFGTGCFWGTPLPHCAALPAVETSTHRGCPGRRGPASNSNAAAEGVPRPCQACPARAHYCTVFHASLRYRAHLLQARPRRLYHRRRLRWWYALGRQAP